MSPKFLITSISRVDVKIMLFRNRKLEVFCAAIEYAISIIIKKGCFELLNILTHVSKQRKRAVSGRTGAVSGGKRAVSSGLIAKHYCCSNCCSN